MHKCFDKIKATPKDAAIEKRYRTQISQIKTEIKRLNKETESLKRKLGELTEEIANSLLGDSKFTPDVLSMAIETTKGKIADNVQRIAEKQNQLNDKETDMLDLFGDQYSNALCVQKNKQMSQNRKADLLLELFIKNIQSKLLNDNFDYFIGNRFNFLIRTVAFFICKKI